jgi:hypothetical protein
MGRLQQLEAEMKKNGWSTADEWNNLGVKYCRGEGGRKSDMMVELACYVEALKLEDKHAVANDNLKKLYDRHPICRHEINEYVQKAGIAGAWTYVIGTPVSLLSWGLSLAAKAYGLAKTTAVCGAVASTVGFAGVGGILVAFTAMGYDSIWGKESPESIKNKEVMKDLAEEKIRAEAQAKEKVKEEGSRVKTPPAKPAIKMLRVVIKPPGGSTVRRRAGPVLLSPRVRQLRAEAREDAGLRP